MRLRIKTCHPVIGSNMRMHACLFGGPPYMTQEEKAGCSRMLMGRSHLVHTAARKPPVAPLAFASEPTAAAFPQKL